MSTADDDQRDRHGLPPRPVPVPGGPETAADLRTTLLGICDLYPTGNEDAARFSVNDVRAWIAAAPGGAEPATARLRRAIRMALDARTQDECRSLLAAALAEPATGAWTFWQAWAEVEAAIYADADAEGVDPDERATVIRDVMAVVAAARDRAYREGREDGLTDATAAKALAAPEPATDREGLRERLRYAWLTCPHSVGWCDLCISAALVEDPPAPEPERAETDRG